MDISKHSLYKIYEKWPYHFSNARKLKLKPDHSIDFYNSVIFCGMGGSAAAGDIINTLTHKYSPVPSVVIKGGSLPTFIGNKTLAVIISVSGNTEETLSMTKEALERQAEVICISSGGKLKELARRNGIKHLTIPHVGPPRASLPYLVMPCLSLVKNLVDIRLDFETIQNDLELMRNKIIISVDEENNPAKQISRFFRAGLAFCFASPILVVSGTRFKDSLNENAKVHCLSGSILEISHNGIVPFTFKNESSARVLLLSWSEDSKLVTNRFNRLCTFFEYISQPYMHIMANEKDQLSTTICSAYLLDFSTIYMAMSRKIDPSFTPAIDILKGMKKSRA